MKTMLKSLSLTKVGTVELKEVSDKIFSAAQYILFDYSVILGVGEENGTCARIAEAGPIVRPRFFHRSFSTGEDYLQICDLSDIWQLKAIFS